jgi:small-conductance mechanosensitive channel
LISAFWFLVVLQVFGILPGIVGFMKAIDMPFLGEGMTFWKVVVAIFWCIISLLIAGWFIKVYSEWIQSQDSLHPNIRLVFDRVGRIILMVVAVLLVLDSIGFNLAVLSVFGGALGVGIGFGLQKIASNYISGFIILLDRSIKLGDLVRVAGFQGTVREINTRYTVVRNMQGIECIVPNENFVTSTVENMSYSDTHVRGTTTISVAYDANIDLAIRILLEIADAHPRVDHSRSNYALVTNFGADGVDIELGYWIADPQNGTGGVKSDINREILRRFDAAGIEVPYAQRELRFRGEPTIRVVHADKP